MEENKPLFPKTTKYMQFLELKFTGEETKTRKIAVCSIKGGLLGDIKWFGRWRQYAFFPSHDTVWNPDCLKDICDVIDLLKKERSEKTKKLRSMKQIIADARKYGGTTATKEEMAPFFDNVAKLATPALDDIRRRRLQPPSGLMLD